MKMILDTSNTHGHDLISIHMLKLCPDSICQTLQIIFKICLRNGRFPLELKKADFALFYMKGDKQTIANYRPSSILHICGKIRYTLFIFFLRIIYFLQV